MIPWLLITVALSQEPHHEATGQTVLDIARRPVPIRTGIGSAHDSVGTSSPDAQAFYDQGLAYLHSYVWLEAARSFNRALAVDPKLAIAYAGLSVAYTELNASAAAREAIAKAEALAAGAGEHDRRHIELRALQQAAERSPGERARLAAYRSALDAALMTYRQDEELWLARGHAESGDPAERGQGSGASSAQYYQRALTLAPNHFAAHHYLTHAYENTGRVDPALVESAAYAKMAPNVPHARHMRGHNLRRAGRIQEAIEEFRAADALETEYFRTEHVPAEHDWHYQHNLDLLASSYQYAGQMRQAEALFKQSFAIDSTLVAQEVNKRAWPMFLMARGRIDEALKAAAIMTASKSPVVSAAGHIMAGEARLAAGQYQQATEEANAALRLMRNTEGAGMVANSLQALQGEFFLRTGQREKGRAMLLEVAKNVRAEVGPDAWTRALFMLDAIARAARDAGDWELALSAARQMIEHDPNYAGGHYALALVAQHDGDRAGAQANFEQAAKYWKDADSDLAELRDIKGR